MKKEDINVGDFILVPKEFFADRVATKMSRLVKEGKVFLTEDGKLMCRVDEDIEYVKKEGSLFVLKVRTAQNVPGMQLPYAYAFVPKCADLSSFERLSDKDALRLGIVWSL